MSPLAIAGTYVIVGALWIALSSIAVETLSSSPAVLARFETLKGWGFVLVTGAILYVLLLRRASALQRSELARAEREGFYRSLIEHASDSILVLNAEGTVQYASPSVQRHSGYAPENIAARNAFDLIHPEDLARVRGAFERALENPAEVVAAEYRLHHADGSWRHASSVGRRLPGDGTRLVINTRDITDSRVVEEQFRRAQKFQAVGELTAGIVHDVNNVLAVVLANAELLLSELPDDRAEEQRAVQDIKRAALGGADMVRKLLGFSRQADLHIGPLDPLELLNEVGAMLRRILAPNIRLQVEVPKPVPPMLADSGAVVQVLLNLATNARDAMPNGGSLKISASQIDLDDRYLEQRAWVVPGSYVRLDIRDTGIGMDDRTKARIFEPFFTTKPAGKGTGLGMAMVQGLVKQHGGHVEITSVVGLGTTVTVFLPAASTGSTSEPKAKHAPIPGGTELLLLVEDEEALRRSGRRSLEKFGYTVLTAGDGEAGLRVLDERGGDVDLILTDVQMPGMGGVQFYHEIRRRLPTIPVLFTSGEPALSFRESNGLEDARFLQKPWTLEEAAAAVRAALDQRAS